MDINQMHFTHPSWLWVGILIPLIWFFYFRFFRLEGLHHRLEQFIDKRLLPFLLIKPSENNNLFWKTLPGWTFVWLCLSLALAGPRWNYREVETYSKDQHLVILLDLSNSMNATDAKPSRLGRAKQKIEDIINQSKGVKIGLLAFAADPHMISPLTEDKEMIRHLLPSLETDLIHVQGSKLSPALEMAMTMFGIEHSDNQALLLISDGGYEDASAITMTKRMSEKGIIVHAMGVGTLEGSPLKDSQGNVIQKNGSPILSKLQRDRMQEISKAGNGKYLETHYSSEDEMHLLKELERRASAQKNIGKKIQFWDEGFYLFIIPVLPFILCWFRRGYLFIFILFCFNSSPALYAFDISEYFKNTEEQGKNAFEQGDYEKATNIFEDPYRKGIAHYKAGNFGEAEKFFRQSRRLEVASHASFNLGNSLVQQEKYQEAVAVYEDLLKKNPDYIKAKENLELVKQLLDQQKEQKQSDETKSNDSEDSEHSKDNSEGQPKNQETKNSPSNLDKNASNPNKNTTEKQESSDSKSDENKGTTDEEKNENIDNQEKPGDQTANENQSKELDSQNGEEEREEKGDENLADSPAEEEEDQNFNEHASEEKQKASKAMKSQEDHDADQWLNKIKNDPKPFLKNKFYIESKKNGTKEAIDPW